MNNSPYIRPEAIAILGGSQHTVRINSTVQTAESSPRHSRWEQVESWTRKVCGYIQRAFQFVKDYILPIAATTVGLLNAYNKYQEHNNAERVAA